MGPGRDLDALVAEKVMGWTKETGYYHPKHTVLSDGTTSMDWDNWESRQEHPVLCGPNRELYYLCACNMRKNKGDLPNYSTDISAAWEVVDKEQLLRTLCLKQHYIIKKWQVIFIDKGGIEIISEAETAPHAICLAALKAVGVEI